MLKKRFGSDYIGNMPRFSNLRNYFENTTLAENVSVNGNEAYKR